MGKPTCTISRGVAQPGSAPALGVVTLSDSPQRTCQLLAEHPVIELLCGHKGQIVRVKIDTADLSIALSFTTRWTVANFYPKGFRLYAYKRRRGVTYYLHRILTGTPAGMEVDHENHDSLDNRRSTNLRVVTHQQNLLNRVDYHSEKGSSLNG